MSVLRRSGSDTGRSVWATSGADDRGPAYIRHSRRNHDNSEGHVTQAHRNTGSTQQSPLSSHTQVQARVHFYSNHMHTLHSHGLSLRPDWSDLTSLSVVRYVSLIHGFSAAGATKFLAGRVRRYPPYPLPPLSAEVRPYPPTQATPPLGRVRPTGYS